MRGSRPDELPPELAAAVERLIEERLGRFARWIQAGAIIVHATLDGDVDGSSEDEEDHTTTATITDLDGVDETAADVEIGETVDVFAWVNYAGAEGERVYLIKMFNRWEILQGDC